MTNNASGNAVLAFRIGSTGGLNPAGTYRTGGLGTGSSLADQGALALTGNHAWLLVVDAGSHQLSVFHVRAASSSGPLLVRTDVVGSRGVDPVSVTVHGDVVFVLNDGNATHPGNVAGFALTSGGLLLALPHDVLPLSTSAATGAAQVSFNPSGSVLLVTEKSTSDLDTYTVSAQGIATGPTVTASNGSTPYGFAFAPSGRAVVSDAGPGALSSYRVGPHGGVSVVSGTALDNQAAPCWVVIGDYGTYAYTSNAHSNSVSTYWVASNGSLTLVASVGATTAAGPTDLALTTTSNHYLLVYDSGAGELEEFVRGTGGALSPSAAILGLPSTAEGLVAY
jgi:6-phosphogluconolactonase